MTAEEMIDKQNIRFRFEVLLPSGDVVEVSREVYERQDEGLRRIVAREEK